MTDLTAHIGATLRWHRERARLTQRQLAETAGTTQATLANIERGTRPPSVDMLERLFAALGVQVRLRIEPLDAQIDAEIAQITKTPLAERLADCNIGTLVDSLNETGLAYVIEGAAAALLHGAPVPVKAVNVDLLWSDADDVTVWLERRWAQRWNERWGEWGFQPTDPRLPGGQRMAAELSAERNGHLRARMCDELPEAIEVRYGERAYQVRPLAMADPHAADLLRRYRELSSNNARRTGQSPP